MPGIYIHIPFCKTKCTYCDFYKITDLSKKDALLLALQKEIGLRQNYLNSESVSTIYFGGGTPSTMLANEIGAVLNAIYSNFQIDENCEITLEANPDDLSATYLSEIRKWGVNRLSIGVQSFDDKQLKIINRRHSASAALEAIKNAQLAGFENISIDLIYGLPEQNFDSWRAQVHQALELDVQHISAYGLTYEEGTLLWGQIKKGKIRPADDETMIEMYKYLVDECGKYGFEQYEISNFAKNGLRSKHNSAYWKEQTYLGIGPAAHSYNGNSRQWNIASVSRYCEMLDNNEIFFEKEVLSTQEKYNDFVMVSLRTMEGINLELLESNFGSEYFDHCMRSAQAALTNKKLIIENNYLRLTSEGVVVSDSILVELFRV